MSSAGGFITISADGTTTLVDGSGLTHVSIKGTKENAICSNRGLCSDDGTCDCFNTNGDVYGSSDGYGNAGIRGDCG